MPELEVAARLRISQSPVREALRLLESEGIVVKYPNRGSFVVKMDAHDVWELGTLRSLLESYAGELAASQIDEAGLAALEGIVDAMEVAPDDRALSDVHVKFHKLITSYSRHARIIEVLDTLESQIGTLLSLTQLVYPGNKVVAREHRLVLDAFKSNASPAQIRNVLQTHFDQAIPRLLKLVSGEEA